MSCDDQFLQAQGATMSELAAALEEPQEDVCDELITETVTELMASLLDYECFRSLMFKVFAEIGEGAVASSCDSKKHARWQSADHAKPMAVLTPAPPPPPPPGDEVLRELTVMCPEGIDPGMPVQVETPAGPVIVEVPAGVGTGMTFVVSY